MQAGHLDCVLALLKDGRTNYADRERGVEIAAARDCVAHLEALAAYGVAGAAEAVSWRRRRDFFTWHRAPAKHRVCRRRGAAQNVLCVLEADERFGVTSGSSWRMMNVVAGAVARFL